MTTIYWPSDLPDYVIHDGFATTPRDGRLRSPMELGPSKVRRRSAGVQPVSGGFYCTLDEVARFNRFWYEELFNGSLPFFMPDRMFDGAILETESWRDITTESDATILVTEWWHTQFSDLPQIVNPTESGTLFRVSFGLELLP